MKVKKNGKMIFDKNEVLSRHFIFKNKQKKEINNIEPDGYTSVMGIHYKNW